MGANGAGKTNLLESLHLGTQGFSPRARSDAEMVRFGSSGAMVAVRGERSGVPIQLELTLRVGAGKEAKLNGARLRAAEQLRLEIATLVFTPDRLAVVKAGPAARRAYFDRVISRLSPARALLSAEYAAALAQRNVALRRVAAGASSREALAPWTARVADLAAPLVAERARVVGLLEPGFALRAAELGLERAALAYDGRSLTQDDLNARLDRDLGRGTTGIGPHLDDVGISSSGRDLRSYGSQGQQRIAVLALLLAEAELIAEQRKTPPLLLLDDVLSELDGARRKALVSQFPSAGQTVITATARGALPVEPSQLIEVELGVVRVA